MYKRIYAPDKRIADLVSQKAEPQNRSEQEISGYRDVLNTIHQSYDHIPVSRNIILQLLSLCPDVSTITVERALKSLFDAGVIEKTGAGPGTAWCKKIDKT